MSFYKFKLNWFILLDFISIIDFASIQRVNKRPPEHSRKRLMSSISRPVCSSSVIFCDLISVLNICSNFWLIFCSIFQVIAAEGEQKASRALKEAADVINESPSALQLRYLQTLTQISAEKNSTIIFPLPIDMLKGFNIK